MDIESMSNDELRIRHVIRGIDEAIAVLKMQKSELQAMLPKQGETKAVKIPPLSEYRERRGKR